jgi:hypothetical protein
MIRDNRDARARMTFLEALDLHDGGGKFLAVMDNEEQHLAWLDFAGRQIIGT